MFRSHFHQHIHRSDLNPMHTALLASRYAQQEREQQSSALFYRQQQQNQQQIQSLGQQQPVITSPLIMVFTFKTFIKNVFIKLTF